MCRALLFKLDLLVFRAVLDTYFVFVNRSVMLFI